MPLSAPELTIATLFLSVSLKFDSFPIQSVLNAAARLIARLPKFSHISSLVNQLHWLGLRSHLVSSSKFLFSFLIPNWLLLQNILWITFAPLYLQFLIDHSAL